MPGKVSLLTQVQRRAAVAQIVDSANFAGSNPHLSAATIAAIKQGTWPDEPVFSPYAETHDGYSQSKCIIIWRTQTDDTSNIQLTMPTVRFEGTKYLCHRITFASRSQLQDNQDVSHVMYLGWKTSK